jgi:hypothetical protein
MGSYWALKGHLTSSQGDHWDRVHSDQKVLAVVRRGRLVQKSIAQRRPRVSKLRAKGLSGCHPSGQQPRQPDRGPEGQIKDYSHDNLLKETSNGQRPLVKEKASSLREKRKDAYSML